MRSIQNYEVIEGGLKAEKDTGDFGGPNMWRLYVMTKSGRWESIQWMDVYRIQELFRATLPVYREISSTKYQIES